MNKLHVNTATIESYKIGFISRRYGPTLLFNFLITFINIGVKGKNGVLEMYMKGMIKVACKSSLSPTWEMFAVYLQSIIFCCFITILLFL